MLVPFVLFCAYFPVIHAVAKLVVNVPPRNTFLRVSGHARIYRSSGKGTVLAQRECALKPR